MVTARRDEEDLLERLRVALPGYMTVRLDDGALRVIDAGREVVTVEAGWVDLGSCGFELSELDGAEDVAAWLAAALEPACSVINVPLIAPVDDRSRVRQIADPWSYLGVVAPVGQRVVWAMVPGAEPFLRWQVAAAGGAAPLEAIGQVVVPGISADAWALRPDAPVTEFAGADGTRLYLVAEPDGRDGPVAGIVELPGVDLRGGGWVGRVHDGQFALEPAGSGEASYLDELLGLIRDAQNGALAWDGEVLKASDGRIWLERTAGPPTPTDR